MCGIIGLYCKTPALESNLGHHASAMLEQMTDRGPDSAGFAIYRNQVPESSVKVTLRILQEPADFSQVENKLVQQFGDGVSLNQIANHAVVVLPTTTKAASNWITENLPECVMTSIGSAIEIYKEKGLPGDVIEQYNFESMSGSHALGHTRMATESAVTTEHSHPFSTGLDLCLVHNGSLSNHNQLREKLRKDDIEFQTDNDSEVAAGYLTWRLGQGASLNEALESALIDLDGFYTFAIGTKKGFAVLRDPIACKPAVIAETDEWVAMSSEFRAIAQLPGSDDAKIWEPEPATIYTWGED